MGGVDEAAAQALAERAGVGSLGELAPLAGGANNRVFRAETDRGPVLLKAYFRHPGDPRDRLGAEFSFSRFAWARGVRCIAKPLACDEAAGLGLFDYVAGEPTGSVGSREVDEALEFFRQVNRGRKHPDAAKLPRASESCLSLNDHYHVIGHRVERLQNIEASTEVDRAALEFAKHLAPAWEAILAGARKHAALNCLAADSPLPPGERCISPSDFGFHNAIRGTDGRLRFIDFEYAGWDDPAKLICDFFCQPAVPVPANLFERFASTVAAEFPSAGIHFARASLLLPVYRVKWICILLNEFLPVGSRRREFSGTPEALEARKAAQLAKAKAALALIQLHSPTRKVA
jgi:hypothetical protein